MAMIIKTMQCYPKPIDLTVLILPAPEADHKRCAVGFTKTGVFGGWYCPCPCHQEE